MSDHLERLRAWRAFASQNRPGYDHMRDVSYNKAPVCDADLDADLDELERLRAERADQVRLARSAYASGWSVHAALATNAVQRMSVDLREQSARDYADEIFPAQAAARTDAVPQRPEGGDHG